MTNSNNDPIFVTGKTTLYSGNFSSTDRIWVPNYFAGFSKLFIAIESPVTAASVIQVKLDLFSQISFNDTWVTVNRESFVQSCISQKKSYNLISLPSEVYLRNVLRVKVNTECFLTLILYP